MNKLFVLLLVPALLFVSLIIGSKTIADINKSVIFTPTPPSSVEIEKIALDKKEVLIPVPPKWEKHFKGTPCVGDPDTWGFIAVETIVRNPNSVQLTYAYTVSGGRIIGQGEKVVWDLKGVRPGNYTVDVAIDYGRGFVDKAKSETVAVREPICDPPCSCPTLAVSGGGSVKPGETVTFTANVLPADIIEGITYNWTVSQGEIIEGQGTPTITVKTSSAMTGEITATVKIGGSEFCEDCMKTASESATIVK